MYEKMYKKFIKLASIQKMKNIYLLQVQTYSKIFHYFNKRLSHSFSLVDNFLQFYQIITRTADQLLLWLNVKQNLELRLCVAHLASTVSLLAVAFYKVSRQCSRVRAAKATYRGKSSANRTYDTIICPGH